MKINPPATSLKDCHPYSTGVSFHDEQASARATLWFLVHTEIAAREMVELAVTNWMAARKFGADQRERSDLEILAGQLLDGAQKTQECWIAAGKCTASAWGILPPRHRRGAANSR